MIEINLVLELLRVETLVVATLAQSVVARVQLETRV